MNVHGIPTRPIRPTADRRAVEVIDQTRLPYRFCWQRLTTRDAAAQAIRTMVVRGAPLIGATAAYGMALAMQADASDAALADALSVLGKTRPTAVNLHWSLARLQRVLTPLLPAARAAAAWQAADAIAEEDVAQNRAIGEHGLGILRELAVRRNGQPVRVMTHCNAGWLATVDYGTALSPVFLAHDVGIPVRVHASETRPRNQGLLTAWELAQHGVPHTLVADNAAGFLMSRGEVDVVIVGTDRVAANGDVANKIGTYLKAVACQDHGIPFYVATPGSTIDFACPSGADIPIEARDGDELRWVAGIDAAGGERRLRQYPAEQAVLNPAFDVTPARLVTGLITERGVCTASAKALAARYPERQG